MADLETLAVYATKALDYADKFARSQADCDLRAFMDALPVGGAVLDLGCGPGNSAAMLRDAGFDVTAWDASPEMVALAQARYGITAVQARFDDLSAQADFDGIWANFSLLHAPKVDMPCHLARIARALRPGGVLHLGMKLGTGEKRDALGRFYAFYTVPELQDLLRQAGLTPMACREGRTSGLARTTPEPFAIIRAHA
jgi:SAM-dependent methyltransferase